MKLTLTSKPSHDQLLSIKEWLLQEERQTSKGFKGFYCNWNVIESAYESNELLVFSIDKDEIAFLVFSGKKPTLSIDHFEVAPSYRQRSLGLRAIRESLDYFRRKDYIAVDLYCSPVESEGFWRKCSFTEVPSSIKFRNRMKRLYRILVDPQAPTSATESRREKLNLWTGFEYVTNSESREQEWILEFQGNTRKLDKPIVTPVAPDWTLTWLDDNEIKLQDEVRRFGENEILSGGFLVVNEMKKM